MMCGRRREGELARVYDLSSSVVLGQGGFGIVYTVRKRATGERFAVKSVSAASVMREEIEIQRALDHPNICRIYDVFDDEQSGKVHVVMELCSGGSLISRMRSQKHAHNH
eukprot:6172718-Pleurochrysis_carterae.AAC.2